MKALTRVALYTISVSVLPFSFSYAQEPINLVSGTASDIQAMQNEFLPQEKMAQEEESDEPLTLDEAKELIKTQPGAKDAIGGEIETKVPQELYDIYGRQLAYRENAKLFRKSLNERRKNFEKPHEEMVDRYHSVRDKVYEAETAAYQAALDDETPQDLAPTKELNVATEKTEEHIKETHQPVEQAPLSEKELKEQKVLGTSWGKNEDIAVRRKIITAKDAPAFDPLKLRKKAVIKKEKTEPKKQKIIKTEPKSENMTEDAPVTQATPSEEGKTAPQIESPSIPVSKPSQQSAEKSMLNATPEIVPEDILNTLPVPKENLDTLNSKTEKEKETKIEDEKNFTVTDILAKDKDSLNSEREDDELKRKQMETEKPKNPYEKEENLRTRRIEPIDPGAFPKAPENEFPPLESPFLTE